MKKITTTQKILILTGILSVCLSFSYVYLYKKIEILSEEIVSVESDLAVANKKVKNKKDTTNVLNKTVNERKKLLSGFVSSEDPTKFLELIESTGKKSGVDVEVQSLNVESKEKESNFIKTVLLVKGDWESVFKFISLLEVFPYMVTISQSTFTSNEDGRWEGQIALLCAGI